MTTNPYSPPNDNPLNPANSVSFTVSGPAMGLIVVSIICIVVVSLSLLFSGLLLLSGTAGRMRQPSIGISKETQIALRISWASIILVANVMVLVGALKMRRLQNYSLANFGAILAVIPCIGPCYLLGIPFGIWALVALHKPGVKDAFDSLS